MKERPILFSDPMVRAILAGRKTQTRRVLKNQRAYDLDKTPFGRPGDRLWVREAHYIIGEHREVFFRATQDSNNSPTLRWPGPWRPSIHMPRWASRITLEVTGVRLERLRDISEADAVAEGVSTIWPDGPREDKGPNHYTIKIGDISYNSATAAGVYRRLWEQINGPYSWEENPWVWVIEFERTTSTKEAP